VGDQVYVKNKHYRTLRTSHKLEHRNFGPYTILQKINNNAYEVDLPSTLRAHKVLPVSILTKAAHGSAEALPVQASSRTPEIWDGVITSIHRFEKRYINNRKVECVLVHWEGYNEDSRTWEPLAEVSRDPMYAQWKATYESISPVTTESSAKRTRRPTQRLVETL